MPRAYDAQQLTVDRNPLGGLNPELSQLPKLVLPPFLAFDQLWQGFIRQLQDLTGINLLSPAALLGSIQAVVDGIGLTIRQIVEEFERLTGLNINEGPLKFLDSLVVVLFGGTGLNLGSPEALFGSIEGLVDGFVSGVTLTIQQVQGAISSAIAGFPSDFANIGAAVTAAFEVWQNTLNQWLGAFTGTVTETASVALTAEQIAELMATTAANASALTALQTATQGGLTNMVASGDDFERPLLNPAGSSALWEVREQAPGAGGYNLAAGQMTWADQGTAGNLARYRRINPADAKTVTPYQRVTRVVGSRIAEGTLIAAGPGIDYLYARVSDDFTKYVFVAADGDGKVTLGYTLSGPAGETPLATATTSRPTAGSAYAVECGDAADLRSFRVLRNNVTVLSFEDRAGKTSTLDTLTGWGWGGKAQPRFGGQSSPSSIHSITVADIPPEPTIGSFLHAVRRSPTKVTKASGDQVLPQNTFDDVLRNSPDVTMDLKSGVVLIARPGPYTLAVRLDTGADLTTSEEWEVLLYEQPDKGLPQLRFRGGQVGGPHGILASAAGNTLGATFNFYSAGINRQWVVGFRSTGSEGVIGNAQGDTTWLTVTRGS